MRLMVDRPFWRERLDGAWRRRPLVWLTGVRRVGKTTLARGLEGSLYLNCDLPSTARRLADPERFLASVEQTTVVLDEVHQLTDPSRLLKIAVDEFPHLRILATGSSTLAATSKFRDSLTGRKAVLHLVPVLLEECPLFGLKDLRRRLLHGGLPEAVLDPQPAPERTAEWLDSYFARDVQELFRIGDRRAFLAVVEAVLRASGGLLEVTGLAKLVGASRPTVMKYLDVLEVTHVITRLRPYHAGGRQELVRQPKLYGFDTGFVAFVRGWETLRDEDCGQLWEHVVLDTIRATLPEARVHFWRDTEKRELDFVLPRGRGRSDAIECKWNADAFSPKALIAFRKLHPEGRNFVLSPIAGEPYEVQHGAHAATVCSPEQWSQLVTPSAGEQ